MRRGVGERLIRVAYMFPSAMYLWPKRRAALMFSALASVAGWEREPSSKHCCTESITSWRTTMREEGVDVAGAGRR